MRKLISLFLLLCPLLALSQGFTPRRPFVLTSVTASNQTPEQLASYGLALRWVASDLGTNSLNVNTWTDRMQSAVWRMDEATLRPAYTTNDGVSINLTHYLTNNTFGPYFATCSNCCAFGFILDITSIPTWNSHIYPPLICNALPGIPGGPGSGDASLSIGLDNAHFPAANGSPLDNWNSGSEQTFTTNGYPVTNVWHDLISGNFNSNVYTKTYTYAITNGVQFGPTLLIAGAYSDWGWGNPGDVTLGYSNFPTSLAHNWWRDSAVQYSLKELWIWTNNYYPIGILSDSIVTNFHIYATNTYGYTP